MIKDVSYWRRDILRTVEQLERRVHQTRWNAISFSRTEQSVMVAFYVIRRILESRKGSSEVLATRVRITEYARNQHSTGEIIAPILQTYFDLDHPIKCDRELVFVCHQVVHSYIFSVAVGYSAGFEGIYFSSDRLRNRSLFFLPARTLINLLRMVGSDPGAEFSPWIEERLSCHRVQTAFPQPRGRHTRTYHLMASSRW